MDREHEEASACFLASLSPQKIQEKLEGLRCVRDNGVFITRLICATLTLGDFAYAPGITVAYGKYCFGSSAAEDTAAEIYAITDRSYRVYREKHPSVVA